MKLLSNVAKKKKGGRNRGASQEKSCMNMHLFIEPTYTHRDMILGKFNPSTHWLANQANPTSLAELLP